VATYSFPTAARLEEIGAELEPQMLEGRDVFDIFPIEEEDADILAWELWDNYTGLLSVRGLGGDPPRVKPVGSKRFQMPPGYYGEFTLLDEAELTRRAQLGSFVDLINIDDLVYRQQEFLRQRSYDRQELMGWTLLATGTFSVPGPSGAVLHTDSYTTQTFTSAVPWATVATATPLADFRSAQLLGRGRGVDFGAQAVAYMNRTTWNSFIANQNNADLYGRRQAGFGTFNNITQVNELLQGDDLPAVKIMDRGYLSAPGTFVNFIPNNKVVLVGKRMGARKLGSFALLRNINELDTGVGMYERVIDRGETDIPRKIEIHLGWNGGIRINYPSSIVIMTV
jgi:hypothetical protein